MQSKRFEKFGFIPYKNKNIKFPHIGHVLIEDDAELATGCTIDRGSLDNYDWQKHLFRQSGTCSS